MRTRPLATQAGFSMVEMLMTAFILAIGILGLTMLQVMSLQGSRGGRSLTTAVQVADRVMDQIELEGRLTWLNTTDTQFTAPAAPGALQFINGATVKQSYDLQGKYLGPPTDPPAPGQFFTVTTTRLATAVGAGPTGQIHDFTVRVDFTDNVDVNNAAVPRSVTLTRRILHG
jgi:prepilin-type N-terminal cleavage/methylation domain-containing protein